MEKRKLQPMMRAMVAMVLLLCAGMLNAAPVSYYLKIAGVEITSDNVNDIEGAVAAKGDGCEAHGVTYDPVKHELHLDNATIIAKGEGVSAIDATDVPISGSQIFYIYMKGVNTLESEHITIYCCNNLSFYSDMMFVQDRPQLKIKSTGLSGIEMIKTDGNLAACSIKIISTDVEIQSVATCISGFYNPQYSGDPTPPHYFDLTVYQGSSIDAVTTSTNATVTVFSNMRKILRAATVTQIAPTTANWNTTQHAFYEGDAVVYPKHYRLSDALSFKDNAVEQICLSRWDENSDGKIDNVEVRKITSLGENFRNNTAVTSFYELAYFHGLETMATYAFLNCPNLKEVLIPITVKTISSYAFSNVAVETITIRDNVEEVNDFAFFDCKQLNTVSIGSDAKLRTIGSKAFSDAPLTSLTLPSHLESIGQSAFSDNRLTTLVLPASLNNIGQGAFQQPNLTESCLKTIVVERETPATVGENCFGNNLSPDAVIYVPDGRVQAYKTAWPQYAAHIKSRVTYPIEIAGIRLAENNIDAETGAFSYNDGTGKRYVEGVRYVPSTHTLYLDDGNINATSDLYNCGIYTDSDLPLHIVMTGNSQIVGDVGINTAAGFTIEGETVAAYLMISSQKTGVIGKNMGSTTPNNLVFKNCEVSIRTTDGPCINGYYCVDPDNPDDDEWGISPRMVGKLVCQKVNLELSAIGYNVVKRIGGYNQTDCHITYPTSGTFGLDLENGFMIDTGSGYQPVKDYFKIERNPESIVTGISELTEEGNSQTGTTEWYTLDGRKLNGEPVKSGIYLMNGRKVVVK
jgi:hypothetical protein